MTQKKIINMQRIRRTHRVRKRVRGSASRPRLTVFRSSRHIYCQIVDDSCGKTLASASTRDATLRDQLKFGGNKSAAEVIGAAIAERAKAANIELVCFDRGPYKYHGRVAALADAARKGGLQF